MVVHRMKEELKYATMASGARFVMMPGEEMMLELLVGSWDSLRGVSITYN